jgi:predicted acyl esterase
VVVGEFSRRPTPIYQEIRLEKSVLVPMRDGIRLSTDIYSPVAAQGPLPTIDIISHFGGARTEPWNAHWENSMAQKNFFF